MRMTYGIEVVLNYDADDAEHRARRGSLFVRPSGRTMVRGAYSSILRKVRAHLDLCCTYAGCCHGPQGTRVRDSEEILQRYSIEAGDPKKAAERRAARALLPRQGGEPALGQRRSG